MRKDLIYTLALTALVLTGCGGAAGQEAGAVSGTVAVSGSSSMERVIGILGEQFMADNPGVRITYDATGSGAGIGAVQRGSADIGLSSRALRAEETDAGLRGTTLALDGIAVIVNSASGVTDLGAEQVAALFTGAVTDWSQVGGSPGGVSCVGREAGSGTREGFETSTGTVDACRLDQELTSTGAVIEAVAGNPNAIGYAALSAVEGRSGVRAVTVNGAACTEETIRSGSYPIQRPFLLVTREGTALSAPAQAFWDFAVSEAAADLIRAAGAVPAAE